MKRLFLLVLCVFVMAVWMIPGNVGAQGDPATPGQAGQVADKRVVPPYMSVRDKVMVQREIQERAAASRNALKRQAWLEEQGLQKGAGKAPQR